MLRLEDLENARKSRSGAGVVRYIIAELGELIEDEIIGVARELAASVIDLLAVALRAGGADDILRLGYPGAQPLDALLAHAGRQYCDPEASEDAGNRNAAAAVIAGRWPDRLLPRRVEPAGHQVGEQAAIGRQNLVCGDHREETAERHDDRRTHPGQFGWQHKMGRDLHETAAAAVVIPVHAEQVGRVGPIGIDLAERRHPRLRHARRLCALSAPRPPLAL